MKPFINDLVKLIKENDEVRIIIFTLFMALLLIISTIYESITA